MLRTFMRAKIHRAVVTRADVDYVGSITLDPALMRAAGLLPLEQVDVLNCSNGNRLTTYCIAGAEGSGEVGVNGAAALLCRAGDIVLAVAYGQADERDLGHVEARTLLVRKGNRPGKVLKARAQWGPTVSTAAEPKSAAKLRRLRHAE